MNEATREAREAKHETPEAQRERTTAADRRRTPAMRVASLHRVVFAEHAQSIETPEGSVRAAAGDAIVVGAAGERWPVPRERFERTFRPATGQPPDTPGLYWRRPQRVQVWRAGPDGVAVSLGEGRGELQARAGDFVVEDDDGARIVSSALYASSYVWHPTDAAAAIADYEAFERDRARRGWRARAMYGLERLLHAVYRGFERAMRSGPVRWLGRPGGWLLDAAHARPQRRGDAHAAHGGAYDAHADAPAEPARGQHGVVADDARSAGATGTVTTAAIAVGDAGAATAVGDAGTGIAVDTVDAAAAALTGALARDADALATRYAALHRGGVVAVPALGAAAVTAAVVPFALSLATPYAQAVGVIELAVLGTVLLLYRRTVRWGERWLDHRALAETFRIAAAQPTRSLAPGAPWWLTVVAAHARWLHAGRRPDALHALIVEQRSYHARTARHAAALLHSGERLATTLFIVSLLGCGAHLVLHAPAWLLATAALPAWSAALHAALVGLNLDAVCAASRRVTAALDALLERPASSLDERDAERVLALLEQAFDDWHRVHRERRTVLT